MVRLYSMTTVGVFDRPRPIFIDSVSGKVGVKSTRGETGGLHSFGVSQG